MKLYDTSTDEYNHNDMCEIYASAFSRQSYLLLKTGKDEGHKFSSKFIQKKKEKA